MLNIAKHFSRKFRDWASIVILCLALGMFAYFAADAARTHQEATEHAAQVGQQNQRIIEDIHDELAARAVAIAARFCAVGKVLEIHMPNDKEVHALVAEICAPPKP